MCLLVHVLTRVHGWPEWRGHDWHANSPPNPPALLPCRQVETIKGWVQSDFPSFAGKAVTFERCHSMVESGNPNGVAFHATCDGKGPTVTVIKTSEGNIFGGATDGSWGSGWTSSEVAFLFCIKCMGPMGRYHLSGPDNYWTASLSSVVQGPTFGVSPERDNKMALRIAGGDVGAGFISSTSLGHTYTCPVGPVPNLEHYDYPDDCKGACNGGDDAYKNYMPGETTHDGKQGYFKVADYEVFVLKAE